MPNTNIILCGIGGQGTILASKLLAAAAMQRGIEVKTAETIGMAQRGGSVFSHIRLGEGLHSPLIAPGKADLILAFEPAEAVRHLPYLKKGGSVITAGRPVFPTTALIGQSQYPVEEIFAYLREHVEHLSIVDSEKAAEDLGSARVLNVVLLGAALKSGALGFTKEDILDAIHARVNPRFHELNERALEYGYQ